MKPIQKVTLNYLDLMRQNKLVSQNEIIANYQAEFTSKDGIIFDLQKKDRACELVIVGVTLYNEQLE